MRRLVHLETARGALALDPALGNLRALRFLDGARTIAPLHEAPWLDEPDIQARDDLLPIEKNLAGDFFCAPFGASDLDGGPAHGHTANSAWRQEESGDDRLAFALTRTVMGAQIQKRLTLAGDAPLLYQEHRIHGGAGLLSAAHHPMLNVRGGARFTTSAKRSALTPAVPLEPGRNALACPARATDLTRFPAAAGGFSDLGRLPIADGAEDFVTLIEAEGSPLGWSAVLRERQGDVVFFLKDPAVLPVTMLWHSNGGRDHAPWNGRHRGILGVEDGRAAGAAGHRAATVTNPVSAEGVETAFALGGVIVVKHVIGAFARPDGWEAIVGIALEGATLTVTDIGGEARHFPFDPHFFANEA